MTSGGGGVLWSGLLPDNLTQVAVDLTTRRGRGGAGGTRLSFTMERTSNGSFLATILQDSHNVHADDDVGALYYVVVVILIYGCSILLMITSYIRKNSMDQKLNRYVKDMALVRKRETQMKLLGAATRAASLIPAPDSLYTYTAGHSYIASRITSPAVPKAACQEKVANSEDDTEAASARLLSQPPGSKNKATICFVSPRPVLKRQASSKDSGNKGISPLLKNALLSGVAVGMWEGSNIESTTTAGRRKNSTQSNCGSIGTAHTDDEADSKKLFISPDPSEFELLTAEASTNNTSNSSLDSFLDLSNRQKSKKLAQCIVDPPSLRCDKRHSVPGVSGLSLVKKECEEKRRKSDVACEHLQVVSTV